MKVKVYFLEAPMSVSGVAQVQMVGSFIMKKYYPLYFFYSQRLSGVTQRQKGGSSHQEKVTSTASIFLWLLWVRSWVLGGSGGQPRGKWGQFYQEKAMSTASIFLWILEGLMELSTRPVFLLCRPTKPIWKGQIIIQKIKHDFISKCDKKGVK